jgi:prevent-host-death family protein
LLLLFSAMLGSCHGGRKIACGDDVYQPGSDRRCPCLLVSIESFFMPRFLSEGLSRYDYFTQFLNYHNNIIIMILTKEQCMPIIRPISDLRNNFTTISQMVHTENEPVFLTKNGVGDMVVMSLSFYEKQLARIELYQKLQQAHDEIADGAVGKDARTVLKGLLTG